MKFTICLLFFIIVVVATVSVSSAALIDVRIDVGKAATAPLGNWNIVDSTDSNVDLIDFNTGLSSGVIMDSLDAALSGQVNEWNLSNPGPDWLDTPKNAARDYVWQGDSPNRIEMVLSGLKTDGTRYDVAWISSTDSTSPFRYAQYTANGIFADAYPTGVFDQYQDGYVDGEWLTWSSLLPDVNGRITLLADESSIFPDDEGSRMNAVRVLEIIPEPASVVLLGLGSLMILSRRLHQH